MALVDARRISGAGERLAHDFLIRLAVNLVLRLARLQLLTVVEIVFQFCDLLASFAGQIHPGVEHLAERVGFDVVDGVLGRTHASVELRMGDLATGTDEAHAATGNRTGSTFVQCLLVVEVGDVLVQQVVLGALPDKTL